MRPLAPAVFLVIRKVTFSGISIKTRSSRIGSRQKEAFIKLMEKYPRLSGFGRCYSGPNAAAEKKRDWSVIARIMNDKGPVKKTPEEWKESWLKLRRVIRLKKSSRDEAIVPPSERVMDSTPEETAEENYQETDDVKWSELIADLVGERFTKILQVPLRQRFFQISEPKGPQERGMWTQKVQQVCVWQGDGDIRMRCDPCKIRFLKAPWFIGHLVRCPRWKENKEDVLEYFATVSKKKLVFLKRSSGVRKKKNQSGSKDSSKEPKKPPTCFTCFCGQEFLSQSLHSAHVQQCLDKVMSSKKDIQVVIKKPDTTTIEETTVIGEPVEPAVIKHEVVEMDDGRYKMVVHDSNEKEMLVSRGRKEKFHLQKAVQDTGDAGRTSDDNENIVVIVNKPIKKVYDTTEDLSQSESLEALEREVMEGEEDLQNQELDDTVMQLEYFEEVDQLEDSHQENVANEVEVGTYEEVEQIPIEESETAEERTVEDAATLSPDPPAFSVKSEPTLDIEGTVCDCGRRLSSSKLLTHHLKVCKYYNSAKSPAKQLSPPKKTVVLINCVCKAQFTKTNIKQHLLHCDVWTHVKMKKNLVPGSTEVELVENVCYVDYDGRSVHPTHLSGVIEGTEEVCEEAYGQEEITDPNQMIAEICPSSNEDQHSDMEIGEIVTVGQDFAVPQESTGAESIVKEEDEVRVIEVVPQVTYSCECGVNFRHLNMFKVHQSSCTPHLKSLGKHMESPTHRQPARIRKEDIVLKYDKLPKGEVLQNCECGFKIASIFALRQHQSACPAVLTKRSSKPNPPKKSAPILQKRVSLTKDDTKVGSSKRTNVELQDELKDLIKIGTPAVRLRKKK